MQCTVILGAMRSIEPEDPLRGLCDLALTDQDRPQIAPLGIGLFNKIDLPCAKPVFELFLAFDRFVRRLEPLIVDEPRYVVRRGEAGQCMVAMLGAVTLKNTVRLYREERIR